jgi:hypothetical protein
VVYCVIQFEYEAVHVRLLVKAFTVPQNLPEETTQVDDADADEDVEDVLAEEEVVLVAEVVEEVDWADEVELDVLDAVLDFVLDDALELVVAFALEDDEEPDAVELALIMDKALE